MAAPPDSLHRSRRGSREPERNTRALFQGDAFRIEHRIPLPVCVV